MPDATTSAVIPAARVPLHTIPPGAKKLRLYSPIWRDRHGDIIAGHVLSVRPVELPNGDAESAVMFGLTAPTWVHLFDEGDEDREIEMPPVRTVSVVDFAIVAVPILRASLARLVEYAETPDVAQHVRLQRVDRDGVRRYFVTVDDVPAKRSDVDPQYMHRLALERRAAERR